MEKKQLLKIIDTILIEVQTQFKEFPQEIVQHKVKENEGNLLGFNVLFRLDTDKKYFIIGFTLFAHKTKPLQNFIFINDQETGYGFNLTDYLRLRKIDFNPNLLFRNLDKYEEVIDVGKQLLKRFKELIATEEMQKILFTDYKPEVPENNTPYK